MHVRVDDARQHGGRPCSKMLRETSLLMDENNKPYNLEAQTETLGHDKSDHLSTSDTLAGIRI